MGMTNKQFQGFILLALDGLNVRSKNLLKTKA